MPNSVSGHAGENAGNFVFVELAEGGHEVTAELTLLRGAMRVRFESFASDCLGSQKR